MALLLALAAPLPAPYAKLFVDGHTWTYDVSLTTWDAKLGDIDTTKVPMKKWPRHTERTTATCKVAKVAAIGSAHVTKVECAPAVDAKFQAGGIHVATAAGLHRYGGVDMPATEQDLADLEPAVIAAKPKAFTRTKREPMMDSHYTVTTKLARVGGAWCTSETLRGAAHDGTRMTCFGGGIIASGSDDFGGELHDFKYRVRK